VPALAGLSVAQYLPMIVKKAVVGTGHAEKDQVNMMVARLLPSVEIRNADSADALAVAICHAHHAASTTRWAGAAAAGSDPRALAAAASGNGQVPGHGGPPRQDRKGRRR
jgi:crossover junction endodeoxyribonuclease RuvC